MQHKDLENGAKAIDLTRCYAASDRQQGVSRRSQALLAAAGMDAPARQWYVVMVDPATDGDVGQLLAFANIECWSPQIAVKPTRRGGMKREARPMVYKLGMPGYVFVRVAATIDAWSALASVKGVAKILGMNGRPSTVSASAVDLLKAYFGGDPKAAATVTNALQPLDRVVVSNGPFRMYPGTVKTVDDDRGRAIVEILIFGRITRTELDLAQISKL